MNIFLLGKIFILLLWGFVGGIREIGHLGESQGYAQVPSPFEMIQTLVQIGANTTTKTKSGKRDKASPEKERRQNPGCHIPPPLRMNHVLEIRLLGKTILGMQSLKIPLFPMSLPLQCGAPTEPCKTLFPCCE